MKIETTNDNKFLLWYKGILLGEFDTWSKANIAFNYYLSKIRR